MARLLSGSTAICSASQEGPHRRGCRRAKADVVRAAAYGPQFDSTVTAARVTLDAGLGAGERGFEIERREGLRSRVAAQRGRPIGGGFVCRKVLGEAGIFEQ